MTDFSTYFNKHSVFKLAPVDISKMNKNVQLILLPDEKIIGVYKKVRDQVIFTDKRIIDIEVQGVTGTKQKFFNFPYSKIQYFAAQTPGMADGNFVRDSEIAICFANGAEVIFEFKAANGITDTGILQIAKTISNYVL